MSTCPECGAHITAETSCETSFHECLAREYNDPAFGSVHHLTVAAFMLQHSSQLSRDGWLAMRQLLREFLVEHKHPSAIRKQNKDLVDSGRRKWKITSQDGLPKIDRTTWTRTILDVRLDTSGAYCASASGCRGA